MIKTRIKTKIVLMLFFPLLGLFFFSGQGVWEKSILADEMGRVEQLSSLAVQLSALVHETQKERGMTAGFLGSEGKKFTSELPTQRIVTDKRIASLNKFLNDFDEKRYGSELKDFLDNILKNLSRIKNKREAVTALKISLADAIGFYTETNAFCLNVIAYIPKISSNAEIAILTSAYANFLQGKERAGIERAVLSNTFARNQFGPGMLRKFNSLVLGQDVYTRVFFSVATEGQKSFYKRKMSGQFINETERIRNVAFKKASEGNFGVDSLYWFKMQTGKINILKEMEDKLSGDLNQRAYEVRHAARVSLFWYVGITTVTLFLSISLALFLVRSITRPIRKSVEFAKVMATGDFSQQLNIHSGDEIGELAEALDRMAGDLGQMVREIKENSNELAEASAELSTISTQMSGNSEETARQSQTVSGTTENMSTNISTMASASEQMRMNIMNISSSAQEVSGNVTSVASAIEEMTASIAGEAEFTDEVAKVSNEAARMAKDTGETMKTLAEAAGEIGQIIDDIKKIAEQTNLLALNATIEAASAGDAGRGFAVVANEVKELANQSGQAAENITTRIEGIQASTGDAVTAINEIIAVINNINELQCQINSSVAEQTDAANHIAKNVVDAAKGSTNIASSISEVAKGANEVSQNSGQAAKGANEVAKSIKNVSAGARSTNARAGRINESSDTLKKIAEELGTLVSKFKIK